MLIGGHIDPVAELSALFFPFNKRPDCHSDTGLIWAKSARATTVRCV